MENKWACDSLLGTYETERIPIAIANSSQSRHNEANIHRLGRTVFGEDDRSVEERMANPEMRQDIQDAIRSNYDHFDSLDLQLGYVYGQPRDMRKSVGSFHPVCVPGARLPHAWVISSGRTISSLDATNAHAFTLFTSLGFVEMQKLQIDQVPVEVVQVGRAIIDEQGDWTRLMGLQDGVAGILVRPDQHILARVQSIEDVVIALRTFLRGV